MDALVDTEVSVIAVPGSVLHSLDILPAGTWRVRFAEGTEARHMDIGYAWVRLEGKETILQVLFNNEGTQTVIGRFGLDGLLLEFDPGTKSFTPKVGLLPSLCPVSEENL